MLFLGLFYLYVLITGKLMVSGTYGIVGAPARWTALAAFFGGGFLGAAVAQAFYPPEMVRFGPAHGQLLAIIVAALVAPQVFGNHLRAGDTAGS